MKIGWLSAASYATTGYGRMTKEIIGRLIRDGYDIINIGGVGGSPVWGGKLKHHAEIENRDIIIPVIPTIGDTTGRDVIEIYIKKYQFDVIISLWDSFAIEYLQKYDNIYKIAYIPVDSPFTLTMRNFVVGDEKIVAMSKYGYLEMSRWFNNNKLDCIEHGIDTKRWIPRSNKTNIKVRENYGIKEDDFLIMTNGANIGERKQIPLMLKVFKRFNKIYPDSRFFLFTNPNVQFPRGYNLMSIAAEMGLGKKVIFPYFDPVIDSWDDSDLIDLYSASDVYLTATLAEGFGLPMLEAMACGIPVIAPNCSTVNELVKGHGWVYDTVPDFTFYPVWIPTNQSYPVPSEIAMFMALEDAYLHPEKIKALGTLSRIHSLRYQWDKKIDQWKYLLKQAEEYIKYFK